MTKTKSEQNTDALAQPGQSRRDSLKALLLVPLTGGVALSACSVGQDVSAQPALIASDLSYGRTEAEAERDARLLAETYFNEHEVETIATLCDIILPASGGKGGALDAAVPAFVEFMVKERENYQLRMRGGIMWLDTYARANFGDNFVSLNNSQQRSVCDAVAYPLEVSEEMQVGARFFSLIRDLTVCGYYTTEMGFEDLGYVGNQPNIWDGVPESAMRKHGIDPDSDWLREWHDRCIDQSTRDVVAEWDDDMRLLN